MGEVFRYHKGPYPLRHPWPISALLREMAEPIARATGRRHARGHHARWLVSECPLRMVPNNFASLKKCHRRLILLRSSARVPESSAESSLRKDTRPEPLPSTRVAQRHRIPRTPSDPIARPRYSQNLPWSSPERPLTMPATVRDRRRPAGDRTPGHGRRQSPVCEGPRLPT